MQRNVLGGTDIGTSQYSFRVNSEFYQKYCIISRISEHLDTVSWLGRQWLNLKKKTVAVLYKKSKRARISLCTTVLYCVEEYDVALRINMTNMIS